MLKNYITIALRNFKRDKGYALINVVGLAMGMAICIMILLWVVDEFQYDRFHVLRDRIYRVVQVGKFSPDYPPQGSATIPYAITPILVEDNPEIETGVRYRLSAENLVAKDDILFKQDVVFAEPSLFEVFSFPLVRGTPQTIFTDINSIVISQSMATRYFRDADPLGQTLLLNNRSTYTVTGVMQDLPRHTDFHFDCAVPFRRLGETRIQSWSWESSGFVLLHPNTDVDALLHRIKTTIAQRSPDNTNDVFLLPLSKDHLYDNTGNPAGLNTVIIFSFIALFVLLIACINFMNLTTARATKRAMEVGVRKVLGAEKHQLRSQFLWESVITAILACLLSIVLVELLLPYFNSISTKPLSFDEGDPLTMVLLLGFSVLVGLFAGSYPAMYLSRFTPDRIMKAHSGSKSKNRFRNILVVAQFVISIVLITGTVIIYSQINYIQTKELGFDQDHLIELEYWYSMRDDYPTFNEQVQAIPEVKGITTCSCEPFNCGNVNPAFWDEKETEERVLFNFMLIEPNFFDVMGLELVEGRTFMEDSEADKDNYILNEAAVRFMGIDNPVGKNITMYADEGEIIGIVKDFHHQPLTTDIQPLMITAKEWWRSVIVLNVQTNNMPETLDKIKAVHQEIFPDIPFDLSFVDDRIDQQYQDFFRLSNIIQAFSILAIIISCLGLFGLAAFVTEQRTKEISIRKVMGATEATILVLLSRQFIFWIIIANCIAAPIAWFGMNRVLQMFHFRISLTPWPFLLSGLSVLVVALITVSYQTIRAAVINPASALKYE